MKEASKGRFYVLYGKTLVGEVTIITDQERLSVNLWHQTFSHISKKGQYELFKQCLLWNHKLSGIDFCAHCIYRKVCRVMFGKEIHNTKGRLDYIHLNLYGSAWVTSMGSGKKIKKLRIDNGFEFWENLFMEFCSNNVIAWHLIVSKNS